MALRGPHLTRLLLSQLRSHVERAAPRLSFASLPAEDTQAKEHRTLDHSRNDAAILYGPNDLRFEPHPLPAEVEPDRVRVRIRAVGVCASDVHFYRKGRIGKFVVKEPMVIGHESAGDVCAVGSNVTSLAVGDRVALEPGVPCWGNTLPRMGRYNLCPDIQFFATPPVHGSLARFVDHPSDFCFKLPDNVGYEGGAMAEPLSNGIQACRRGQVAPGKKVAILGAGPMGLNAVVAARAHGASRVVITDVREDNLPVAQALGVDHALLTPRSMTPVQVAEMLRAALPPNGPEVVIDCVGFDGTLQAAVETVASGGKVVLVGMGHDKCTLNTGTALSKELDIHGCFRYTNTYPLCLDWLSTGRIDIKPLITHRFPFNKQSIIDGFECAAAPDQTKCIKAMFELPAEDP